MKKPVLALVPLFVTPLFAQTTHLVGPNGLPQIRDALAIAAPGDVIHVEPGTYAHFDALVGVTIRALTPGPVTVAFDPAFEPASCLSNPFCVFQLGETRFVPPTGQAVHVTGVNFAPSPTSAHPRHRVAVLSGTVTFDGCSMLSREAIPLRVADAQLHLQNCTVLPVLGTTAAQAIHALTATNSHLTLVESVITGNDTLGTFPGDAIRLTNSTLKASVCAITGGTIQLGGQDGAAVRTDTSSRVWISDSFLTAGGTGDCAIVGTPAVGQLARTTVAPGGFGCAVLSVAPVVGIERPTPIQNGASFSVTVHTEPTAIVAIHASPRLSFFDLQGFSEPLWLDLTSFFLAGIYLSDTNGDVTATWNMPPGQYVDETVWLEPITLLPTGPILVGPAVGGVIR